MSWNEYLLTAEKFSNVLTFSISHELAHFMMGHNNTENDGNLSCEDLQRRELDADAIATFSTAIIANAENRPYDEQSQAKSILGVLMLVAIEDEDLIPEAGFRTLFETAWPKMEFTEKFAEGQCDYPSTTARLDRLKNFDQMLQAALRCDLQEILDNPYIDEFTGKFEELAVSLIVEKQKC